MKEYEIIWSPDSIIELKRIYDYIYYYFANQIAANRLYNKIFNNIYSLRHFPEMYPRLFSSKYENLRKMVVKPYIIFYQVNNDTRTSIYFTYIS